jgi:hypothetical protein
MVWSRYLVRDGKSTQTAGASCAAASHLIVTVKVKRPTDIC